MMTYFTLQATEPEESDGERLNVFGHICAETSFFPPKKSVKGGLYWWPIEWWLSLS